MACSPPCLRSGSLPALSVATFLRVSTLAWAVQTKRASRSGLPFCSLVLYSVSFSALIYCSGCRAPQVRFLSLPSSCCWSCGSASQYPSMSLELLLATNRNRTSTRAGQTKFRVKSRRPPPSRPSYSLFSPASFPSVLSLWSLSSHSTPSGRMRFSTSLALWSLSLPFSPSPVQRCRSL